MIVAVYVATSYAAAAARILCKPHYDPDAVLFECGRCQSGTVSGAVGDTCTDERCGARVVKVEYDSPEAASEVF